MPVPFGQLTLAARWICSKPVWRNSPYQFARTSFSPLSETFFIRQARAGHPKLDYQRNGIYLRFCHADYHKGAALAELARLLDVARENIFAAGDHHNDISMLDGRFAAMPSCPANAIPEVQHAV